MFWTGFLARRKAIRREDGASLVELALVVGILGPVLLLGTAEVSMLLYASIELTDATHAAASYAARYYSLNSKTLPTQAQVTTAATNDAPELQNMLTSGSSFTATIATGCGTGGATTGNTVPSCTAGTLPYVKVTGSASIVPAFQYLNLSSIQMTSQAEINLVD